MYSQAEEVISPSEAEQVRTAHESYLASELAAADAYAPSMESVPMLTSQWAGMVWPGTAAREDEPDTGFDLEKLKEIGRASVSIPDRFVCISDQTCGSRKLNMSFVRADYPCVSVERMR